ncbi:hypothetical protein ACHAW5_007096 [Stephanodiscus triporus]|uniref:Uncharacterized protein n=1 Tax=Stephanodiscus triporus TaxID=2934178 RepID=A0ABD3NJA9_9STRA
MAVQTRKRDRLMISPKSSPSRITPPLPSAASERQDEYERALAFLRDFHSRRVAACEFSSDAFDGLMRDAPLYAIIESEAEEIGLGDGVSKLIDEFSLALSVDADKVAASIPRMKKTVRSECLIDLVDDSDGGSQSSASRRHCALTLSMTQYH